MQISWVGMCLELIEQQGDHCGWSGVGGWGRGKGTVGDRNRALVIEGFDRILGFCSKCEQGGDLCF